MSYQSKYDVKIPELTEELAYLCGFILGDGSIQIRVHKHDYCIKAVGNPRDEREYYDVVIKELFLRVFNTPIKTQLYDSKTTYGFQFSSKRLVRFLTNTLRMPASPKYDDLKIPSIFYTDERLLKACIRGIFDTDGCVCFKKRYKNSPYYPITSFSSKSSSFIKEIHNVLQRHHIKACVVFDYKRSDARFITGHSFISRIEIAGHDKLNKWLTLFSTWHPKHQKKILFYGRADTKEIIRKIAEDRFENDS